MGSAGLFGFINVAKPSGMTAHDVVACVRRITRVKQVGHGGTLDPMATGVLPVAVGKACRLLRFLSGTKVYLAEIQLGLKTTTDDTEGETLSTSDRIAAPEDIRNALSSFTGAQRQIPPLYSAVHVGGKRLYQLARQGIEPDNIPVRDVHIYSIEVTALLENLVTARIKCSPGTYIRSIARDLGEKLGTGGCLKSLVREQAGPFHISDSLSLDDLRAAEEEGRLPQALIAPETALRFQQVALDSEQARLMKQGQSALVALPEEMDSNKTATDDDANVILATCEGALVAVCRRDAANRESLVRIQPEVVISNGEPPGK